MRVLCIYNCLKIHLRMKKIFILFSLLVLVLQFASAQKISGIIADDKHKGLSYATIRLLNIDSTFVQGTHTDSIGYYSLNTGKKGNYLLNITAIGYKSNFIPIDIQQDSVYIPTISLATNNVLLTEVIIEASSFVRQEDKLSIFPDKRQIKHSTTGYDLLYKLMIPEIDVDRMEGKVSAIGGEATLYIDGRKAETQEIQSLNPKEVEKIEYYDIPSGKYMNDVAAINFITRKQKKGGYVSLNGNQRIGYLKGNYNAVAKLSHNNTSYTLFTGYSMSDYDGAINNIQEDFIFTNHTVNRHSATLESRVKNTGQYAQLNIQNRKEKRSLSGKFSLVHNDMPKNYSRNILKYDNNNRQQESIKNTNLSGWRPSMELYGYFHLNDKQFLETTLGGNYTSNTYRYAYQENSYSIATESKEDLYDLFAIMNYGIQFMHHNSLTIQAYHFQTISSVDYKGKKTSWQHFWEGESMLFLEYNQKFGKKVSLRFGPGLSYIQYRLHGSKKKDKLSPRLHFNLMFYPTKNQQIRLGCPVGSGYLEINQLNKVEQQIDSLQIRRGNPNQKIAFQTTPTISYSGQLGKFNLGATLSYNIINHAQTEDFYIENNHLIRSNHSEGKHRRFFSKIYATWKITDNLRIKLDGSWQYIKYPSTPEKLKNFSGNIQADYYWKDFSCGVFAKSKTKWLNLNLMHGTEPAKYGGYIAWSHKNWSIESGVTNPFTKNSKQTSVMNREVYKYENVITNKLYQPNGYIKIAYIFDFGKKTSRERNDIDTNINSAILKAN